MDEVKGILEKLKQDADSSVPYPLLSNRTKRRALLWVLSLALFAVLMAPGIRFIRYNLSVPEPELVPIPLTSYPGIEDSASFSPDGTQIAFSWCKDIEYNNCDIYVKQIGVEPPYPLTQTPAIEYSPAWSPDGLLVAFLRQLSPTTSALVIIPQRGGRERVLAELNTRAEEIRKQLAWTPDSQWLAFSDLERNRSSLFLISISTGERRRLTKPSTDIPDIQGDSAPAFSPDGRVLAFTRTSQARDLYLLRLQKEYTPDGPPEKIRLDHLYNFDATWMPDGDEIVFSSGAPANLGLSRMPVAGLPRSRRLAFAPSDVSAPAVSRQGGRLAYTLEKFDTNIWRIDLPGPGGKPPDPVQFLSSTRLDYAPAYSPTGNRIAFVSARSGIQRGIWVCDSDGSNPMHLTSEPVSSPRGLRWSWDGQSIAFWGAEGGEPNVYTIGANGGVARRMTTVAGGGKWPVLVPRWPMALLRFAP